MEKFKKISLSFIVVFISAIYVTYQPEKSSPVTALVSNTITPDTNNPPPVTSKIIKIATPIPEANQRTQPTTPTTSKKETPSSQTTTKKTPTPVTKPIPPAPKPKPAPVPTPAPKPKPAPVPIPPPKPVPKPTPAPVTIPKGKYKDGTYKGSSVNAYYGYVQVKPTISGGKIVAVDFLKHPDNRQTSQYINAQAMPLLEKEAIQAQDAKVSGVSGATFTSTAFRQSLADALAQAKNI